MGALTLDRVASVWRTVGTGGGDYALKQAYSAITCAIVPISSFPAEQNYAYEATHIIWVPHWLVLRKEDELRSGRRPPDAFGNILPETYVIGGRRRYSESVTEIAFYGRLKD